MSVLGHPQDLGGHGRQWWDGDVHVVPGGHGEQAGDARTQLSLRTDGTQSPNFTDLLTSRTSVPDV